MGFRGAILVVFVAVAFRYLYFWLVGHGVGVRYHEHFPGKCHVVPGVECGSEKIVVTENGMAFITNGLKGLTRCNVNYLKGNIYIFDFRRPSDGAVKLEIQPSDSFSVDAFDPHGMDFLENEADGTIHLYVVNHAKHVESVEVFQYDSKSPESLLHLRTIHDKHFVCINDLTLLGENKFYITNYLKYCHYPIIVPIVEFYLSVETGNVIYHDQGESKMVATGVGCNGIAQSLDKKEVVVAAGSTTFLDVYEIIEEGDLKFKEKIDVTFFPDNLSTDHTTGDYYAGVQKQVTKLLAASQNQTSVVTASGVRVSKLTDGSYGVEEVFHDNGRSFVQGVATVLHYKGQYLFGTIFDKLAYCDSN
jgi:Arylesterase.